MEALFGLITRGLMQSAGGALVGNGMLNASDLDAFVQIGGGIAVNLLAYGWSVWQKKRSGAM